MANIWRINYTADENKALLSIPLYKCTMTVSFMRRAGRLIRFLFSITILGSNSRENKIIKINWLLGWILFHSDSLFFSRVKNQAPLSFLLQHRCLERPKRIILYYIHYIIIICFKGGAVELYLKFKEIHCEKDLFLKVSINVWCFQWVIMISVTIMIMIFAITNQPYLYVGNN